MKKFRLDDLPKNVQSLFSSKLSGSWVHAVTAARGEGMGDPNDLADIIFFMQHPERMIARVGRPIEKNEEGYFKLIAEWNLCLTIANRILNPTLKPGVFLTENRSKDYEHYVAAPTRGHITLMVNGRNQGGLGDVDIQVEAFDSMQQMVESLGPKDSIYIANWQFAPKPVCLTLERPSVPDMKTWADLLKSKAKEGVKIRIIVSEHPPYRDFMSNLAALEAIVKDLSAHKPDNFKYIVSPHPSEMSVFGFKIQVGVHHQKLLVVKKGRTTIAYCGGLDISFNRTPRSCDPGFLGWTKDFVWHDTFAKLEGLIARDLEREFVLRWNREKNKSKVKKLPGWKDFETLVQAPVDSAEKDRSKNVHKLQMLRTVSVGMTVRDIRRDDIWQGYFRLIGRATRFIFLENQYFYEPKLADAIVLQSQAQPNLIVIIVVSTKSDDPEIVNPKDEEEKLQFDFMQNALALRHEFFKRLFAGLTLNRRRVYTMFYPGGLVHSKLILVDDEALSIGSANANPRGFFMDSELNVMLDDAETVKNFRQQLWSHDLGVIPKEVAEWKIAEFLSKWDTIANFNKRHETTPEKMVGEGIIPFSPLDTKGPSADPRASTGKRGPIRYKGMSIIPDEVLF